jgi:hypothetical protein
MQVPDKKQWKSKEHIWESTRTPTPKVGVPLGVWGFIPSHSFALSGAWNVTPEFPSWPSLLQALALVVSPRLGLRHFVINVLDSKDWILFSHYKWELCCLVVITNNLLCSIWFPLGEISFKKLLWCIFI